jgi:hypothetical protein
VVRAERGADERLEDADVGDAQAFALEVGPVLEVRAAGRRVRREEGAAVEGDGALVIARLDGGEELVAVHRYLGGEAEVVAVADERALAEDAAEKEDRLPEVAAGGVGFGVRPQQVHQRFAVGGALRNGREIGE